MESELLSPTAAAADVFYGWIANFLIGGLGHVSHRRGFLNPNNQFGGNPDSRRQINNQQRIQTKKKVDFSLKETSPNLGGGRVSGSERLTSSFDLVEQLHFLYIRIERAKGLPEPCDPFVEVKIGHNKTTTKHFEKKSNPEWNEVFGFSKDRIQGTSVEITVKNKAGNKAIGIVSFPVSDIPNRVPPDSPLAPQWHVLADQDGKKGEKGELMMAIWMGTQVDEVFPHARLTDAATVTGENILTTRSKVYLSPRLWYLRINLIQAQDLVFKDKNKKPEISVKAYLGNLALSSRMAKDNSTSPTWNEDMMFVAAEPFDDPLILSVEDKNDCLGKCVIYLSKVQIRINPTPASADWYNLERVASKEGEEKEKDGAKSASRLHMRISLDGGYHVLDEPTYYNSDFKATSKSLWGSPVGVLELGILNAKDLLPMSKKKGATSTNAFCVAKYGSKWVRTRTIVDSLAPNWNKQYTWEVYDPYTVISIGVFHNGHLEGGEGKDEKIGKVRIRLSTLQADKIYTHAYPLVVLQSNGVKKMGELQLAVRFTCPSYVNLLLSYSKPLFPKMHYSLPLSVHQIESLRNQASNILSKRLSRAEPPLRNEVVEYMLDVGSNLWSLRKGRANFKRILATLDGFVVAWKWFDHVKTWKNASMTVFAHVVFLIFVTNPQMILASVFFFSFLIGLWNIKNRPRHPPHMDTKISLVESVSQDELDEEFDTFPTSKKDNVLKMRYDRLRTIAGRMMVVMGDLATQGERFRHLLNWRDPRATLLFLVFCLAAVIVVYVTPYKVLVVSWAFFMMRHPRLRVALPSVPRNFFRLLPTRLDSML